jgi:hypothetical protein
MNAKKELLEESENQEINYFRVLWAWKWAVIAIPLVAMIAAMLIKIKKPLPELYETRASIVISGQGNRNLLTRSSFESIAFLPAILQKIIDQLSLKNANGTSMDQNTLKNQLRTQISGASVVIPGYHFFIARNESPDLAKQIADLWVRLVEKEAKKIEAFNISSSEKANIKGLEQKLVNLKSNQLNYHINQLTQSELKLAETRSVLSTYQERLRTFSNSKVHFIPHATSRGSDAKEVYTIIQQDTTILKKESSAFAIEANLHSVLKALILKNKLDIAALESKIHLLNTKIKKQEQELIEMFKAQLSGQSLKNFSIWNEVRPFYDPLNKFVSNIATINYASLVKTPIAREKYTAILLAGIISFGFILMACVLKAHIDAMRPGQKI